MNHVYNILELSKDIVYMVQLQPEIKLLYMNSAAEEVLGIKVEDHYQYPYIPLKMTHPDDKILMFDKEEDLGELVIRKENVIYDDNIRWYTDNPFIYSVEFRYTEGRAKEFLDYLKKNMIEGYSLELWNI